MSQSCGQPVQVSALPKQGAPWQFNNPQCHLGAISLPLGTVVVIISGQNTFSGLITCWRWWSFFGGVSFFPGTVSSFLPLVVSLHPASIILLIYHLWSLSSSVLSLLSGLGNWQPLDISFWSVQLRQEFPLVLKASPAAEFLFLSFPINFHLWLICSTYMHIIKLPWLQIITYSCVWKLK